VWLTNPAVNKWLSQQANVTFQTAQSTNPITIKVDGNIKYQQIEGFGAALTDSSAWLINQLSTANRNTVMNNLFNPSTGIGLNLIRIPMGATDVNASGNYSYDDLPVGQTDPTLAFFSVQHDQGYIIPELQQVLSINPAVKITTTAWSPPGWMKSSGSMIGGTLLSGYESILANYYVKFIQAYASAGIPISYVTPQNEPMGTPTWPGMFLSAYQETAVVNQMGSAFAANNITTSILAWDHNWDVPSYPETIFNDSTASQYAIGTGWHVYSGSPIYQTLVHNDYPSKKTFLTEATGGIWQANNNVALHDSLKTWIIDATRNYANGVMLWNIALDPNMGPLNSDTNGIPEMRPLVTIDPNRGTATYNVDYYALAHASKFVKPGAYRIYSNTFGEGSIDNVAFQNPDGTKVLIAHNSGTSAQTFVVADGTQMFSYNLPQNAGVTFTWSGPTQSGTIPAAGAVTDPTHDFAFSGLATTTYDPALLPLQNSIRNGNSLLAYSLPSGASIQTGGTALSRTGWVVTASSNTLGDLGGNAAGAAATNAIDGNLNSRWTSGHGLKNGDWYQINMGSVRSFNQIVVDTGANSSFDYINGYQVYISNDAVNWGAPLATGTGRIGPVTITLPTTETAQYIRIVSTGSTSFWWSIGEINVYSASGSGSIAAPISVANGLQLQNWTSGDGKAVASVYNGTTSSQNFAVGAYSYTLPKGTSAMFTTSSLSGYPTPAFSSMTPTAGLPGYLVTITGTNFGATQGLGTVTFGSIPASINSWSNTSITAYVPQGVTSGAVAVSINGTSGASAGGSTFNVTALGTKLSRTGWVATASVTDQWGDVAANMLDGDLGTRWSSGTGEARNMNVIVDLGSNQTFNKIVLDSGSSPTDYARGADVYVSTNGSTWTKVGSVTVDGQPVQLASFVSQTARYIKINSTTTSGNWWSIAEFNAYAN
jgi:O-glycosyl hydrolase